MKFYNADKTRELQRSELDFQKGFAKADKLLIAHQEAAEGREAYDEYEDIRIYIPYTAEELKERADKKRHAELKAELAKIKEDIEQETFGLVRDDYEVKKARAAEIINELRVLEGKEPREVII